MGVKTRFPAKLFSRDDGTPGRAAASTEDKHPYARIFTVGSLEPIRTSRVYSVLCMARRNDGGLADVEEHVRRDRRNRPNVRLDVKNQKSHRRPQSKYTDT